ncbi:uncharacterized protein LOC121368149 [Gigantopelta aegis]|uniref:uncharacterized protein LOC121368149 n=1 Tax=Gigantopelta aegis TaxID=1735272 RepID=UPI001B887691|nr:uncharacterized protein LOC121368149 [Gigantopelta aegis]
MPSDGNRLPSSTGPNASSSSSLPVYHDVRPYDHNDDDNNSCGECCGLSSLVKIFFCINIKRSSRIKILWFWIISASVVSGVLLSQIVFGPVTSIIAPTDMRIVDRKYSTIFCESLVLESQWTTFSAYLLPEKPEVVFNKLDRFEFKRNEFLYEGEYKYWSFYLLQESQVTIKSCADLTVDLYVIRGRDNLKRWLRNKYCDHCFVEKQLINRPCPIRETYSFTADVTDEYYFVYMNSHHKTWLTLEIVLERTVYDTSQCRDRCVQSVRCSFDLDVESDQVVVYQISNDDQKFDFDDITITTTCSPRLWVYLLLFLFLPFSLGIASCSLIFILFKDPRNSLLLSSAARARVDGRTRRTTEQFFTERSPLLWGQVPYQPAVPVRPPKYEDVVHGDCTSPPSYEEAVG